MYGLLCISVLAASFNSVLLNKAQIGKNEIFNFNLLLSLVWCIILFILNNGTIHIDSWILFWGIIYGITQAVFVLFKTAAMGSGPVSITTLIGNCSLFITVFISLIIWNESITVFDIIGLVLLLAAIFLCTYKKTDASYASAWKYYVLIFFVFAALVGIVFKAFGKSDKSMYCNDMMLVSAAVMLICYSASCMFTGGFKLKSYNKNQKVRFLIYAILCGGMSLLYNRLNVVLAGSIPAVIFFPAFNGGVVLLSSILSICICRERLAIRQAIGILTGIISLTLIGLL